VRKLAKTVNLVMTVFDLLLGLAALLAPKKALKALGHSESSKDGVELFRRCAPIWFTFSAAHAVAAKQEREKDLWALSWLRATEIATDVLWARSPAFKSPLAKMVLRSAGAVNLAMTVLFNKASKESPVSEDETGN